MQKSNLRYISIYSAMLFLAVLLFFLDLFLGSVEIPVSEILQILGGNVDQFDESKAVILFQFRLPKALTAVLAGAALSVSGLQMQTGFRNPLAGPYVLGISSGASFGVAVLVLGFYSSSEFSATSNWAMVVAAWIGAGTVLAVIMAVSLRVRDIMTILILGIMFSSAISAVVSIMQYFSEASALKIFVIWTMGSLGGVTAGQLQVLLPSVVIGIVISIICIKPLDMMLLGETSAKSLGLNINRTRILVFVGTSLLAGSITAFCGPIGFIGIAVPHIMRVVLRTAMHRHLVPASILGGAVIMLASDIVSQMPGTQNTLPINSVTALAGIPVVIWIILKNRKF